MYRAFIVDDDPVILDEIVRTLPWLDNGFEVAGWSCSPGQAVGQIAALRPDLVLCDLKMPGMDGVDMIKALTEAGLDCEYVMLSAYASFEDSRRFFRLDGFDYLLKPLQQQEVQLVLERLSAKLSRKSRPSFPDAAGGPPAFLELTRHLDDNFCEKHTLDALSHRFGLSANYICSLFSRHLNTTLTRYLTALRMEAALAGMQTPGRPFKEIALACGYTDYYYFCKVFKDYYGAAPTAYMRALREQTAPPPPG